MDKKRAQTKYFIFTLISEKMAQDKRVDEEGLEKIIKTEQERRTKNVNQSSY